MNYSEIKKRIANPGESVFYDRRFCIYNEFGPIAFVHADNTAVALDIAADAGKLDCQQMSESDFREYEANGWDDSYILAGNASEPFWSEYLGISEITK